MKKLLSLIVVLFYFNIGYSQVLVMNTIEGLRNQKTDYEYGYLPGKKFPFFQTMKKYDLRGQSYRVELYDDRKKLELKKINCSPLPLENISEFADANTIYKVARYIDTLFVQCNAVIDSSGENYIEIHLEAIDSRLIGYGYLKAHGLCQIRVSFAGLNTTYCSDIKDGDENSPLGSNAFVTRKSATRIMGSASIREVLEQMIGDLIR